MYSSRPKQTLRRRGERKTEWVPKDGGIVEVGGQEQRVQRVLSVKG